jgi:hypothetical protein
MSDKTNTEPESLTKAVARKRALDAAVYRYSRGDVDFARETVRNMGHKVPDDGLKDLLIELAGEACKAVARAILRGRE